MASLKAQRIVQNYCDNSIDGHNNNPPPSHPLEQLEISAI